MSETTYITVVLAIGHRLYPTDSVA